MDDEGKLLIITGPSAGVGKDTIVRLFMQKHPEWTSAPSMTTRQPREGEVEGKDYRFVSKAEFKKHIDNADLWEWMELTDNYYGTPKNQILELIKHRKNVIVRKDFRGALAIKRSYPKAVTVFLLPDNMEDLEKQFRGRGTDSEELIESRLEGVREELSHKDSFDHSVVNPFNHPEIAVAEIEKLV